MKIATATTHYSSSAAKGPAGVVLDEVMVSWNNAESIPPLLFAIPHRITGIKCNLMRTGLIAVFVMTCFSALADEPFLKQTKKVVARQEWNREIVSRKGGIVRFKVTSPEPFGVTLMTDRARKDLVKGLKRNYGTNDVLLTIDCKPPAFERELKLAAGSYYFILENQSNKPVEFTLECYEVKP